MAVLSLGLRFFLPGPCAAGFCHVEVSAFGVPLCLGLHPFLGASAKAKADVLTASPAMHETKPTS